MKVLPIRLDAPGNDQSKFAGHRVTIAVNRSIKVTTSKGQTKQTISAQIVAEVDCKGNGTAILPPLHELQNQVIVTVSSPEGLTLKSVSFEPGKLPEILELKVTPNQPGTVTPAAGAFGETTPVRGRVIDKNGRVKISNQQVIVFVKREEGSTIFPLFCAKTNESGYFSSTVPNQTFFSAIATVGGGKPIKVNLDSGFLPKSMIIAIDALETGGSDDEGDCRCSAEVPRQPSLEDILASPETFSVDVGVGCSDFTKPNRTIEEFDYYSLVRTTEPAIKGLNVENNSKESESTLEGIRYVLNGILKTTSRPSASANVAASESSENAATPVKGSIGRDLQSTSGKKSGSKSKINPAPTLEFPAAEDEVRFQYVASEIANFSAEEVGALLNTRYGLRLAAFKQAAQSAGRRRIGQLIESLKKRQPGRTVISSQNPLDWDEDPTFYQATTVAHGHLLHIKQSIAADGYSLGDLLYSLPLAPGQRKQIATLDWERKEEGKRSEFVTASDQLTASLSRDRDIREIVKGTLTEHIEAESETESEGFSRGAGLSAAIPTNGALVSVSGGATSGFGSSDSSAVSDARREISSSALQKLNDRTKQSAAMVRSQRSTVIQTVTQGEVLRAETETIANYNHCHAVTIEYFEVLRHFAVRQSLAGVKECLLVPLMMSPFEASKALRWKQPLIETLKERNLVDAFAALDRIERNYEGSNIPNGSYADEEITFIDGEMSIEVRLSRPLDKANGGLNTHNWKILANLLGKTPGDLFERFIENQADKDKAFAENLSEPIVRELIRGLRFIAQTKAGEKIGLPLAAELYGLSQSGEKVKLRIRQTSELPALIRKNLKSIVITNIIGGELGVKYISDVLGSGSRLQIREVNLSYRTANFSGELIDELYPHTELEFETGINVQTPLNQFELQKQRKNDLELAKGLLAHLNENLEYYHRAIWLRMDPARRFMLLDGIIAPNSDGRSVASVVENRVAGLVGNSLVLPVVPGIKLDPTYTLQEGASLLDAYATDSVVTRIAVPSKGVYAESVMGACNSCEKKDESRFWRFEESPLPGQPTSITPINTDSRRGNVADLTAGALGAPIVNMQSATEVPDPTGLGALLNLLGSPDSFNDISGLRGNQRNAMAALTGTSSAASKFATTAADLLIQKNAEKNLDQTIEKIEKARDEGRISEEQASILTEKAINTFAGIKNSDTAGDERLGSAALLKTIGNAVDRGAEISFEDKASGQSIKVKPGESLPPKEEPNLDNLAANTGGVSIQLIKGTKTNERAFRPSPGDDKRGAMKVKARFVGGPSRSTVLWEVRDPDGEHLGNVKFQDESALETTVFAMKPGRATVVCQMRDESGELPNLGSVTIDFSVPQFFLIEEKPGFVEYLQSFPSVEKNLLSQRERVCFEMKETAEHFFKDINVRFIWAIPPFNEQLPEHLKPGSVGEKMVTTIALENSHKAFVEPTFNLHVDADVLIGMTGTAPDGTNVAGVGPDHPNEVIRIFPSGFDSLGLDGVTPSDLSDRIDEIERTVKEDNGDDPDLIPTVATIIGRLLGHVIAHEAAHSLLGLIDTKDGKLKKDFHSVMADDVITQGTSLSVRTGIKRLTRTNPDMPAFPKKGSFIDGGLSATHGFYTGRVISVDGEQEGSLDLMLKHFPRDAQPLPGDKQKTP